MVRYITVMVGAALVASVTLASGAVYADDHVVKPKVMTKADIAGDIFSRPDMIVTEAPGGNTYDVMSHWGKDDKFVSGMFRAGSSRFEIDEPYGYDEFMYFLEGGVTLTSSDGSVTVINAGDAVTIPKEWTGVWETDGYTKIYVIYAPNADIE